MNEKNLNKFITEALAIEAETAKEAGALGYMTRVLVQATLPHKKVKGNEFIRKNGLFTLSLLAPSAIGLPYGSIPRLLLAWITTEAVITKQRIICLGDNLSSFMGELGLIPTGGRWGTITRVKDQTKRLFSSSISCSYETDVNESEIGFRIADTHDLWWSPNNPMQSTIFESTVTLSETFFNEIITSPVPIDLRALKALKRSPLAIDIYCWLTYRVSYLKNNCSIPWEVLQIQFGSEYRQTEQGRRDFKRAFLRECRKITTFYEANLEPNSTHLLIKPSKTHVIPTRLLLSNPNN